MAETAQSFIQHMADEFAHVRKILSLDPVPLSAALSRTLADADEALMELQLTIQLRACSTADVTKLLTSPALSTESRRISALVSVLSQRSRPGVESDAAEHPALLEELNKRISAIVQPLLSSAEHDNSATNERDAVSSASTHLWSVVGP